VLHPDDESKFNTVTYTYYEQLTGTSTSSSSTSVLLLRRQLYNEILKVLDPNRRRSFTFQRELAREHEGQDQEVEHILRACEWQGPTDDGFQLVKIPAAGFKVAIWWMMSRRRGEGRRCAAGFVAENQPRLRGHHHRLAWQGRFDWIWCEHALTVGYRSSLTEIVQIIGRATRDARASRGMFTNLIAEPDAAESAVTEAVNDTLKAIAGAC